MPKAVSMTGDRDLIRALQTLGPRVAKKVTRSAVTAGAKPILKAAKAKAPKRSGLLSRSLATKVKTRKDGTVVARIGAKTNVVGTVDGKPHRPARIAHLVEKGHIDRAGNFTPPRPFLFNSAREQNDAAMSAIGDKLAKGIAKEAAKGGSK